MKRPVLLRLGVIVEVDTDRDLRELMEITNRVEEAINRELGCQETDHLGWQSTCPIDLDEQINCGHCANCGGWTTDCERTDRVPELSNGAVVNGQLLCDECLPSDHRWAF